MNYFCKNRVYTTKTGFSDRSYAVAINIVNRARKQAGYNASSKVEVCSQLKRPACLRARFTMLKATA